jgi:hypothetical protein
VLKTTTHPVERVLAFSLGAATLCLFLLDLSGTRFRNGNLMAYYWVLAGLALNSATKTAGSVPAWFRRKSFPVVIPSRALSRETTARDAFKGVRCG